MLFPATCVDGFFDNPDKVRDFALSLEFSKDENGTWPGKRTEQLHAIAPEYFEFFSRRLLSIYYDFTKFTNNNWQIATYFQLVDEVEPLNPKHVEEVNTGWVHLDYNVAFAGVIYLNRDPNPNSGTSLFTPKGVFGTIKNGDVKAQAYKTGVMDESYVKALQENNSNYIETVRFNNVYNRLVSYDGTQFHAANSFLTNKEPRLTQVFFVHSLSSDWFPIPSTQKVR